MVCPAYRHQVARLYQPADGWPLRCRRCNNLTDHSTPQARKMPAGPTHEFRYLMG
jgi:hypothetical protein